MLLCGCLRGLEEFLVDDCVLVGFLVSLEIVGGRGVGHVVVVCGVGRVVEGSSIMRGCRGGGGRD